MHIRLGKQYHQTGSLQCVQLSQTQVSGVCHRSILVYIKHSIVINNKLHYTYKLHNIAAQSGHTIHGNQTISKGGCFSRYFQVHTTNFALFNLFNRNKSRRKDKIVFGTAYQFYS